MKQILTSSVVAVACALLGAAGGFYLGKQSGTANADLMEEMHLHRAMLAHLQRSAAEPVSQLGQERCAMPAAGSAPAGTANFEDAVFKALQHQAQIAKAQQDALSQPSDDSLKAFADGEQLVAASVAAKRWTDADVASLHALRSRMTGDQVSTLMQRLSSALNEGKVVMRTSGPPF